MYYPPPDWAASVRPVVEAMGGKVITFDFVLGEHDVIAVVEAPDNVSMADFAMAVGVSGALKDFKTTVLLTMDEAVEAMRKAGSVGCLAPGD